MKQQPFFSIVRLPAVFGLLTLSVLLLLGSACSGHDSYQVKITVYEKIPGTNLHTPVDKVKIDHGGKTDYTNARGEVMLKGDFYDGETMQLSKQAYRSLKLEIRDLASEAVIIERVRN